MISELNPTAIFHHMLIAGLMVGVYVYQGVTVIAVVVLYWLHKRLGGSAEAEPSVDAIELQQIVPERQRSVPSHQPQTPAVPSADAIPSADSGGNPGSDPVHETTFNEPHELATESLLGLAAPARSDINLEEVSATQVLSPRLAKSNHLIPDKKVIEGEDQVTKTRPSGHLATSKSEVKSELEGTKV